MKKKTILLSTLGAAAALALALTPFPSNGQAVADDPALSALVAELTAQQVTLVNNQVQIDAKLAVIAENVRLARIFVSRGGGAPPAITKPPK